jgi:ABC-type lipoprotein release transport system permease subunit
MKLLRIAVRNIGRNRRRTVLNTAALSIGVAAMIIVSGWIEGYHTYIYSAIIDLDTGHAQIENASYRDEARRLPVDITVPDYAALQSRLSRYPDVAAASGRIEFAVKVSYGSRSAQVLGRAVDPAEEARVTLIGEAMVDGEYLDSASGILLSAALADRFGVSVGDTMFITAVDRYGVNNLLDVRVVGLFDYDYPVMDNNIVFFDLNTARNLLRIGDEVTQVVLRFTRSDSIPSRIHAIESLVEEFESPSVGLTVRNWREFAGAAVLAVEQDTITFRILLGIVYFLILLGILNSMSMTVYERTREIASLRAIGMKKPEVVRMLLWEGGVLGILGFTVGCILALPAVYYLGWIGMDIGAFLPEEFPAPFGDVFFGDYRFSHYVWSFVTATGATVLASYLPARRASGLQIAEAMRSVR